MKCLPDFDVVKKIAIGGEYNIFSLSCEILSDMSVKRWQ